MPRVDEEPIIGSDDDEPLETGFGPPPSNQTFFSRLKPRTLLLEPAVFLVFFGKFLADAVYQNQILYHTCVTIMKYNATECEPFLGTDRASDQVKKIEGQVQEYASTITMISTMMESAVPAIVSLFLGPWSDKFGRRPILLSTYTGYLTSAIIMIVLTQIARATSISPWWFLLSSVPMIFSGGTCALITILYCHVSDVATEDKRAMRMVTMEACLGLGMLAGGVASGYIYASIGASILYILVGSIIFLALVYVYFVKESLKSENIQTGSRIREFFRLDLAKDLVRTCIRKRENYDRAIIGMVIMSLALCVFAMEGEGTVNYMFMRKQFDYTVQDYSIFNSARVVIQIVGSIIAMILLRRLFGLSNISMTLLAFACCILEATVRATAVYRSEMYLALVVGMMRGVMSPMSKAILSNVTPSSELGKVFSLTTSLQSISPLGAAPLYTAVYKATVEVYPGVFNFISVGLYSMCYIMSAVVFGIQKSMVGTGVYQVL
ncbi:probable peptidoglycan muropeptide transporter SLC46 [Drosophila bipectinata]|uniref:probable peptidoglycan muropeptide transporter SLC46 n=1 Tax=Drosophila bipectinata TaxID=42026 RepID=UPI001C892CAA|nr:proton-coupled folate transporter [Drosophila bipectinata]